MELKCKDCGELFDFPEGEEAFLRETFKENYVQPKRCKPCKQINKAQNADKKDRDYSRRDR